MSVKHEPATPLPWEVLIRDRANGIAGKIDPVVGGCIPRGLDAVYIAHAANAYPKLVQALRDLTERIADAEQWNPAMKPDQFRLALGTVQGAEQFKSATVLLRDLGETP